MPLLDEKIDSQEKLFEALFYDDRVSAWLMDQTRCQVKNNEKKWWQAREELRIELGVNEPILIDNEPLENWLGLSARNAYPVQSEEKNMVSYIPNERYAEKDSRTSTRLGRFLTHFQPSLGEATIRDLSAKYKAKQYTYTLHIAQGAEITRIYKEATSVAACMSKDDTYWPELHKYGYHPTAVYDSPDVCLAYVKDTNDHIVARTLINKVNNTYIRIYGNKEVMELLLKEKMNITEQGSLNGARLKRIVIPGNKLVLPYIDTHVHSIDINRDKDYLYVTDTGGDIEQRASHRNGFIQLPDLCPICNINFAQHINRYFDLPTEKEKLICTNCFNTQTAYKYGLLALDHYQPRKYRFLLSQLPHLEERTVYYAGLNVTMYVHPYKLDALVTDYFNPNRTIIKTTHAKVSIRENGETINVYTETPKITVKNIITNEYTNVPVDTLKTDMWKGIISYCPIGRYYTPTKYTVKAEYTIKGAKSLFNVADCIFDTETNSYKTKALLKKQIREQRIQSKLFSYLKINVENINSPSDTAVDPSKESIKIRIARPQPTESENETVQYETNTTSTDEYDSRHTTTA